jgi:putative transposase
MTPGHCYHIFNHANGRENLFVEEKNYIFFLRKLSDHILPVCHIYAYCLMKNHFHLLARIKPFEELSALWKDGQAQTLLTQEKISKKTSKAFANFFSSYTQAFNKTYDRTGSLFIPSMKTQPVEDKISFCKIVHYIHANPVHHRFVKGISDWKHSSYKIFLSEAETKIERQYVLDMFGGLNQFIEYHQQPIDPKCKWIG